MGTLSTYKYHARISEVDMFVKCAFQWVGTPYRWGGDDPSGIDCSGLVQECLKSIGKNPPGGDKTADGIYRSLLQYRKSSNAEKGCILFFGDHDEKITHTAIAIDRTFMVEAGGGGSRTKTTGDAWAQNAWVRIRPIATRKNLVAAMPL